LKQLLEQLAGAEKNVAEAPKRTLSIDLQKLRKYKVNRISQAKTSQQQKCKSQQNKIIKL
jgi:hypothetical protein